MTMNLDKRLNECVQTLNDEKRMAKLSGGDAIAQELKYHSTCLVGLYNRERGFTDTLRNSSKKDFNRMSTRLHFRN